MASRSCRVACCPALSVRFPCRFLLVVKGVSRLPLRQRVFSAVVRSGWSCSAPVAVSWSSSHAMGGMPSAGMGSTVPARKKIVSSVSVLVRSAERCTLLVGRGLLLGLPVGWCTRRFSCFCQPCSRNVMVMLLAMALSHVLGRGLGGGLVLISVNTAGLPGGNLVGKSALVRGVLLVCGGHVG